MAPPGRPRVTGSNFGSITSVAESIGLWKSTRDVVEESKPHTSQQSGVYTWILRRIQELLAYEKQVEGAQAVSTRRMKQLGKFIEKNVSEGIIKVEIAICWRAVKQVPSHAERKMHLSGLEHIVREGKNFWQAHEEKKKREEWTAKVREELPKGSSWAHRVTKQKEVHVYVDGGSRQHQALDEYTGCNCRANASMGKILAGRQDKGEACMAGSQSQHTLVRNR